MKYRLIVRASPSAEVKLQIARANTNDLSDIENQVKVSDEEHENSSYDDDYYGGYNNYDGGYNNYDGGYNDCESGYGGGYGRTNDLYQSKAKDLIGSLYDRILPGKVISLCLTWLQGLTVVPKVEELVARHFFSRDSS